jgi:PAS domain S-box-containing protein
MLEQGEDHVLVLLDAQSRIVAWRMAAQHVFGYEPREMLGRTVDALFTPEDRSRGVPAAEVEIADKVGRCEDDRWLVRKDGVRIWVSGILSCLRDEAGNIAGYSKLLRDRTDVKEQTDALRTQADSLLAENQRQTLLLGTLAHELRNPLGALANAGQLIEMAYPEDPKLRNATQLIARQSRYLATLIEDLLEDVRIRTGKVELNRARVDLHALLVEATESVGAAMREKDQVVEIVFPQAPMTLNADATRLRQVFVNLLANASKFSKPGDKIWVKAMSEGDEAVVRIEDRGRGIPAEVLPRIFALFSQAGGEGPSRTGLGLGLAIVKQYVELHGGTVQARSEGPGRGSEFVVRLPLAASS